MDNQDKPLLASFDHNDVFEKEILPRIEELHALCVEHHIPISVSCTPQRTMTRNGDALHTNGKIYSKGAFLGMQHPSIMVPLAMVVAATESDGDFTNPEHSVPALLEVTNACRQVISDVSNKGSLTLAEHESMTTTH